MFKITALTILAVAYTVGYTNACYCPISWMSLGKTCVKLFHESTLTFDAAEQACAKFKVNDCDGTALSTGHLVSIHSQEEQDALVDLVETTLSAQVGSGWDPQVFIGLSVGSSNDQLTWTDGSNVNYISWHPGEPNNGPYSKGAIAAGGISKGNWVDVSWNPSFSYICELPCLEYEDSH